MESHRRSAALADDPSSTLAQSELPMEFLAKISVQCFVFSYLVALALELTRPFLRVPARQALVIGFAIAGLFAHISYISLSARERIGVSETGLLASWYDWALLLALAVALSYVVLLLLRPSSTLGYFFLPVVLGLIAMAWLLKESVPFSRGEAVTFWRGIHGVAMLLVTSTVLMGFVAGLLFLLQSYRLKHKRLASEGLQVHLAVT